MDAAELLQKIYAYGADRDGIRDRFGDNDALYEMCFREFLSEPNFAALAEAMESRDYARAFDAAHALKGLSGNLGLTDFYRAVCALVESLRAQDYAPVAEEYAQLLQQRQRLLTLAQDAPAPAPLPRLTELSETRPGADDGEKPPRRRDLVLRVLMVAVLALILIAVGLFCRLNIRYHQNILQESARHLTEMSNQIRLYIEARVDNDWRIARSVGDSIVGEDFGQDDPAILAMLRRKQAVWGVSDLMLYTESGEGVYADGSREKNDIASDTIDRARRSGEYLSIIDSRLTYTVPVDTPMMFHGARIAAISVVQNMSSFLDEMNLSSFNKDAWMVLTEESGIVVSILTHESAVPAFNFRAMVEGATITPLSGDAASPDLFHAPQSAAFLMDDGRDKTYVVSVPISTGDMPMRLFYLAPEAAVNASTSAFSRRLTVFSLVIIIFLSALGALVFLLLYRSRTRLFNREILARDRMFDLLMTHSKTAFALFNTGQLEPVYISGNAPAVVGESYWALERDGEGYRMRSGSDIASETIRQANEMLRGWDGKSPFQSGYIRSDLTIPPNYFEFQLYPVDSAGTDFVGIAQDVTKDHDRDEATKAAMELATRANEAKSRFLSNMSHDIRTPMNAIMNMTNFALESIDQPRKLGVYLHTIRESSEHLLLLINDVLDMSRIESGQVVVTSAPFELKAEIQRQVDMIRPLCAAKGQTLITDLRALDTATVCGDALKLAQILMNLLSNAVKYTPERGAVRFTAAQIPSLSDELVDVRFTVEDNGIGISQADIAHIFDPFCRAADTRIHGIEGTGLGLSICRSYVEALGGTLRCESELGEGSIFTVELFFRKAETPEPEEPGAGAQFYADTPFLGLHALVAEDNPANQLIAKTLLERLGFMVDLAGDGGEAVQKLMSAPPHTYDVIYMDVQMPVLDGYQAAAAIRGGKHPQAQTIPIVAMTANVFAEDMEKARIAGMDAYVGKPIVSFALVEQTRKALNIRKGGKS